MTMGHPQVATVGASSAIAGWRSGTKVTLYRQDSATVIHLANGMVAKIFRRKPGFQYRFQVFGVVMVRFLLFFAVAGGLCCRSGDAQTTADTTIETISKEVLESRRKQLDEDTQLEESARSNARALYEQALRELEEIESSQAALQQFERQVAAAKDNLDTAKSQRSITSQPLVESSIAPDATLAELEQALTKSEALLKEKTENLSKLDAEPKRRASRLEEIQRSLTDSQQELAEIKETLLAPSDDSAASVASRTAALVRRERLSVTLSLLESERAAYEATTELLQVERDVAAAQFAVAETEAKRWRELVNERRRQEVKEQAREAHLAVEALRAKPLLAELAREIKKLTGQRQELADNIEAASKELAASRETLARVSTDFERAKEKVDAVGLSHDSGEILRRERGALPNLREFRRSTKRRRSLLQDARFKEYQYQDQRLELANLDESARVLAEKLDGEITNTTVAEARELLQLKKDYLDSLIGDSDAYLKTLLQANDMERQLIDVTQQYAGFIDERVLWIRSTLMLNHHDIGLALDASRWLTSKNNWVSVGQELLPKSRFQSIVLSLCVLTFGVLGYLQNAIRRTLTQIGESVARRGFSKFAPTVRAVFLTAVASMMWPGVAAYFAWLLSSSLSEFVRALGTAVLWTACVWLPLEFGRQVFRANGLAESHLGWPSSMLRMVRKRVQSLLIVGLPLLLLSRMLDFQTMAQWGNSLGRVAFIGFLIVSSFCLQRLLFAKGGVVQQMLLTTTLPKMLHRAWSTLFVGAPLVLALLAIVGYYDTAQTLAIRLFQTVYLVFVLMLVHALLGRWVLMRRRRLTLEQARQRTTPESTLVASHDPASIAATQEVSEQVDLGSVSEQTVKLLRTFVIVAGVFCAWLIWADVVPALSILRNYPAWPGITEVTVADVLLAAVIIVITYVATENVPGLLELTLLNYLPVDAGARFATTTLCRYAIAAGGLALAGRSLGITWGSIQWLIAAMGIGLGFGLQEIFANFISGIILLFERPIRVGDIITLGDTTGVVTRIRMRATTVTDWDRKEYVVPNKDLITGRLLNWTLTNQTNRIVIPVGIAYGSDAERARALLLNVARDHPLILEDPAPISTFEGFGDSTLDLVLRCYLPNLENRLPTISELHTAIDREFRNAGIEIAFPQRDIHIRTIQQPLKTLDARVPDELPFT